MRIVGGKHRGRRIAAPPGDAVRPTSERAREALFNILAHGRFAPAPVFEDARVLDVFAGTGAFGLEALSRGARFAAFIEKDRQARESLAANIKALGEGSRTRLLAADATAPPRADGPYDLVFLDPPYRTGLAAPALDALSRAGWLAADALVIVELAARGEFEPPEGFMALEERRYGAGRLVFLRKIKAKATAGTG
ncbi:MAG TPA: 16S rRNA (guanine(966)-N(2))-methyltransferase RsmD [Stellaceae bacterium]|nr:16S rRNA (guanine(966)-N(2))-methyltransferase RsmD [Stellaceae bacterium]